MNKLTSIYLDLIRFTAALVVVLSHAAAFTSLKIPLISGLGTEAVVVFFVLSGYVIAYVSNNKENNYIVFFKARAIRIYSVLIPAILITFFSTILVLSITIIIIFYILAFTMIILF